MWYVAVLAVALVLNSLVIGGFSLLVAVAAVVGVVGGVYIGYRTRKYLARKSKRYAKLVGEEQEG